MGSTFESRSWGGSKGLFKPGPSRGDCVVLLHGFGADADDLAPLGEYLKSGSKFSWFFPQGLMSVPIGPMMSGRAWFQIDIAALDRAIAQGEHRLMAPTRPKGLDAAVQAVTKSLLDLRKEGFNIILGGFSQGAMVATDLFLQGQVPIKKLVILSGTLLDQDQWRQKISIRDSIPIFWSHGKSDPILPFSAADELRQIFEQHNFSVTEQPFSGGHEIPERVLKELDHFLLE